jgi:hypothetical protein
MRVAKGRLHQKPEYRQNRDIADKLTDIARPSLFETPEAWLTTLASAPPLWQSKRTSPTTGDLICRVSLVHRKRLLFRCWDSWKTPRADQQNVDRYWQIALGAQVLVLPQRTTVKGADPQGGTEAARWETRAHTHKHDHHTGQKFRKKGR